VLHNGDIGYADGDMHHWDVFMRKIEPIAARVPYMTSPGNHEFWFNFTAYKARFAMPDDGAHDGMYWSIDVAGGDVHLTAMDTESPLDLAWIDERQSKWLEGDLADLATRRASSHASAGWTIAAGHRPLYCTNHRGQDVPHGNGVLRAQVEATLVSHGVDLVLQAHEHDYERSWPTAKGMPTQHHYQSPTAPVYVVNGAGGNREGNELPPGDQPWSANATSGLSAQTANISYGILIIQAGELQYTQIDSASNGVLDTFTVTK